MNRALNVIIVNIHTGRNGEHNIMLIKDFDQVKEIRYYQQGIENINKILNNSKLAYIKEV